jgi:hypothetical protein
VTVLRIHALFAGAAAVLAPAAIATAYSGPSPDGAYEIISRLELPHVERWAIEQMSRICLSLKASDGSIPIPVFSANNPFSNCTAVNLRTTGTSIAYDIICPGRASAKAHARYTFDDDGFRGRVEMVMAAKNMTMTEVVRARRLSWCDAQIQDAASPAEARAATR